VRELERLARPQDHGSRDTQGSTRQANSRR
jgi:hypothetical protein